MLRNMLNIVCNVWRKLTSGHCYTSRSDWTTLQRVLFRTIKSDRNTLQHVLCSTVLINNMRTFNRLGLGTRLGAQQIASWPMHATVGEGERGAGARSTWKAWSCKWEWIQTATTYDNAFRIQFERNVWRLLRFFVALNCQYANVIGICRLGSICASAWLWHI